MLPAASKHMLGAGSVGVALTVSLMYFILRRFRSPVREISTPGDYLLLLLLLFLFLLGDMISWANSWGAHGFVMTKKDFARTSTAWPASHSRTRAPCSTDRTITSSCCTSSWPTSSSSSLPFTKIVHTFFTIPINLLRRK